MSVEKINGTRVDFEKLTNKIRERIQVLEMRIQKAEERGDSKYAIQVRSELGTTRRRLASITEKLKNR